MKKADYLAYVTKAAKNGRDTYDQSIETWKENFDADFMFGYSSPGNISSQIHMEGIMYSLTGDEEKAAFIRKGLLQPMELAAIFPEEIRKQRKEYYRGVPLLEPLFQLHAYMNAYLSIKDSGILSSDDIDVVKQSVIQSVTPLIFCPEWGAHNRSMLRACALAQAACVVGDTEETQEWVKLADILAEESIGRWSIEDASHYIPLWLFACIMYAKWSDKEDFYYSRPQTRYYFDYLTHLLTPDGQIPGFGDAWFHSNWQIWVACLEMGATKYKSGEMKAAAEKMFDFGMKKVNKVYSPGIGNYMAYAYKWADDSIETVDINFKSEEVLDELVGKKITFRDERTYMLYNFRDEGLYGFIPRQYLRTSIPVKAEKMHHGHGDENSIAHLEIESNVLLHESGYREKLPNGKYRADLYHNKLVFREGIKDFSQGNFNALHDDGYYKHVKTEKIHFQTYDKMDYLRTRNHYEPLGLLWDRMVTRIKDSDVFIVVDWVEAGRDTELTAGNVWHTENAEKISDNAFETYVDFIKRGQNDKDPFVNNREMSLLIEFLTGNTIVAKDDVMRNHGDASMVSECMTASLKKGERRIFVTVLTPHKREENAAGLTGKVELMNISDEAGHLCIRHNGRTETILTYKLDLTNGIHHYIEDRAPAYDWESGKLNYGNIITDADFSYLAINGSTIDYGMLNGCRMYYGDKEIFSTPRYTTRDFMVEKFKEIDHKWRSWSGTIIL
jgi:hypothetical protein